MGRLLKYTAKARCIQPLFATADEEFNIQLVRLIVFYEDLRLEVAGSWDRKVAELDETGKQYRELYFVRRAFATISEIRGALNQISRTKQMKTIQEEFSTEELMNWKDSIQFFNEKSKFIGHQRNLYGGHFLHQTADFVVKNLSPDHVGVIAIEFDQFRRSARVIFKVALELVGIGLTTDRADKSVEHFVHESFETLTAAMRYATKAIHLISDHYLLKQFGFF